MADVEAVRNAVAVDLEGAAFFDVLRAIYAEKDDQEVASGLPAEIHRGQRWQPQQFPCGEVVTARARNAKPDSVYAESVVEVTIFWHVNGTDEERIETQVMRLVRATEDFYKAKANLLPTLADVSVWLGDHDYSPLLSVTGLAAPYVKSGALTLYAGVMR